MHRKLAVLTVILALVLLVRSDHVKCYMCISSMNEGCESDPKAHNLEPVECTLGQMVEWQRKVQQHNVLNAISGIFEVDNLQQYQATAPRDMACAKMILKVAGKDVTARSCQTAKTETIDPCKTIRSKFSNDLLNLEYCDLCMHDACNSSVASSPRILFVVLSVLGAIALAARYHAA